MNLTDMPLELLYEILGWSIQARGIKRGLRLRLVNSVVELFAREVLVTLPMFKLLDSYFQLMPNGEDSVPKRAVATVYLQRRVLNEHHGGAPALLYIRNVALGLSREGDGERDKFNYIRELCALAVESCKERLGTFWVVDLNPSAINGPFDNKDLESDLYITALYTNTLPVVERWLSSGKQVSVSSRIFGNSFRHAARFCSHEILARIWTPRMISKFFERISWARFRGLDTPNREIYDFIAEKRKIHCPYRIYGVKQHTHFLVHCAKNGWTEMAAHYLTLGANVNGIKQAWSVVIERPLILACKNGHREMVELLLGFGTDTSQALETAVKYGQHPIAFLLLQHGVEIGGALGEAVARGYTSIARAILERSTGAVVGLDKLLESAVEIEDEQLFELLEQYVADTDAQYINHMNPPLFILCTAPHKRITMTNAAKPYLDRVFAASSTEESRHLYDDWAKTYDSDMQKHDFTAPRLVAEGVARGLKLNHLHREPRQVLKNLRIVDAGCGTGLVGNELAKMGAEDIVGLDISKGMLEVAQKTAAYKNLAIADLTDRLAFEDGEFDALTCCGTFTHGHLGPGPLSEFVRVVKSGGVVVATILESHWEEKGFDAETDRLVKAGVCEIIENKVHQYRKDAGKGHILILRSI
ncbi:hypothetical protein OPT61_g7097 [Boeremia exigua]|uniref:Uncharacterized protein n=1 Tax=Boeremia exigua TaxID=749465 RepID=A0ACC2I3J3_9PLEO|nr:hypothetical protein OPT61_g7097 [Boeremia exigua]